MSSEDTPVLNKGDEEFDTPVLNKGDREVREGAFSETGCFGVISKLGLDRILAKRKKFLSVTLSEIACAPPVLGGAHYKSWKEPSPGLVVLGSYLSLV